MIYFFKPQISELNDSIWNEFYNGAINTLKKFRPQNILEISSLDFFSFNETTSENDLVIFFNPVKEIYNLEIILKKAMEKNINIFPIAINESSRKPSVLGDNDKFQSFDVVTQKNLRGLDDNYISIIGECFGRETIISYHPALFDDEIKIFLSHKRIDFEENSKLFKKYLHDKQEKVFIDLHELRTGDDATQKIEAKLKEDTDILIFIQTENTYESEFQLIELKKAFELSIPILWVTVGLNKDEIKKLPLYPTGTPHYELNDITSKTINEISEYAFDLIKFKKQRLLDEVIYKFSLLKKNNIFYNEICNRNNIYEITKIIQSDLFLDDVEYNYEFFKCLCRKYKEKDLENLKKYLTKPTIRNYILALKNKSMKLESNVYLKNYDDFFKEDHLKILNGGIIISGSFPDSIDLKYQQNIIDALYSIVKGILERGGKIIFGSHPTFQGIILEIGKNFNLESEKKIKLYVSKFLKGKYDLNYFQQNSEVFEIEASKNIDSSLTEMRIAMVNDSEAKAMICIGGKDKYTSLTKKTGLDEEIELAQKRNLKVFILGSTGGRCKELINDGLENPIDKEENRKEVTFGNNFKSILNIILNEIGE